MFTVVVAAAQDLVSVSFVCLFVCLFACLFYSILLYLFIFFVIIMDFVGILQGKV